jgi:hypothetical protein
MAISRRSNRTPDTVKLGRRRQMAPQSKCTPQRRRTIYRALSTGHSQKMACALAGITPRHYRKWIRKGEQGVNTTYAQFAHRIARIKAQVESTYISIINTAASGGEKIKETKIKIGESGMEITKATKTKGSSWQAAAWRLERMDPDSYGRQTIEKKKDEDRDPEQVAEEIRNALQLMDDTVPSGEEAEL